jgi:hypothetical protein
MDVEVVLCIMGDVSQMLDFFFESTTDIFFGCTSITPIYMDGGGKLECTVRNIITSEFLFPLSSSHSPAPPASSQR